MPKGAEQNSFIKFASENGSVAQLYSASDFGSEGCRLESCRGHKINLLCAKRGRFILLKRSHYFILI